MTRHFSELFTRDNKRCVYCGRDLMVDFETWMLTEEDHLVPLKGGQGADDANNKVIACRVCNKLKGDYVPTGVSPSSVNRTAYIDAVRDEIMRRRSQQMKIFAGWTHEREPIPKEPRSDRQVSPLPLPGSGR